MLLINMKNSPFYFRVYKIFRKIDTLINRYLTNKEKFYTYKNIVLFLTTTRNMFQCFFYFCDLYL